MSSPSIYEDGAYLEHNQTWHQEDSPWKAKNIAKILDRNHISPTSVCEVGCGAGEVLRQLWLTYGKSIECVGYDISPQASQLNQGKADQNLKFVLGDVFTKNKTVFEVAMAIDVFEHVDDYIGFLGKMKAIGRYKVFHIPLDLSVQTVLRGSPLAYVREQVGHIHYFTKDTALATLKHAGYEVIDHFYTAGSLELPNRSLKARLASIPRAMLYGANPDVAVRLLGGYSLMVLAK